ncbi:Serine/threonine-protein kinase PknB [Anatilimnocola aggregata]|uniref:Serine/threonine-protein kinase PknB n=1 Tax=Anatilimnocola aggregata TaxID=2528021 RepID=A0A517YNP3_9BACT|nr:serine/threonine-protein kinase [Anatilimnocola aggregata]QDU31830.1 Serine/threonine-protein kinase PknB [Anatilimnocola aggregata]
MDLTINAGTEAWSEIEQWVTRFLAAWQAQHFPKLVDYLPAHPYSLRKLTLIELIKADLEQRSHLHDFKSLESYAAELPEMLDDGHIPLELICEEYHVRRAASQVVSLDQYCERFPRSSAALRRVIGDPNTATTSTAICRTELMADLHAGQRLDDFELLFELGKGAFGRVYLARQVSMQRQVALKISADKGNEPQTLAQLDHPGIVRVFDQRQMIERKLRLLYMEFAPSGTLLEVVKLVQQNPASARSGQILVLAATQAMIKAGVPPLSVAGWPKEIASAPWSQVVCRIGAKLAEALEYAHGRGILHRDIKPANVLIGADGWPKLADFNISFCSKIEGASPAAYFGGSLAYMSPEQLEACSPQHTRQPEELDQRSDLFSLGVLLWELYFGERPFDDGSLDNEWSTKLVEMIRRRNDERPYRGATPTDSVGHRLEKVLRQLLSPNPEDRPANGIELARQLRLCLIPGAASFLERAQSGWRGLALKYPLLSLIPINIPPLAIWGAINFFYNQDEMIHNFRRELQIGGDTAGYEAAQVAIKAVFQSTSIFVNSIFYPLGVALVLLYMMPVSHAIRQYRERGGTMDPSAVNMARRRVLWWGSCLCWVAAIEWVIAGIVFPTSIHLFLPAEFGPVPAKFYIHFVISQTLCGLMSLGLPWLATTWVVLRAHYPALLGAGTPDEWEQQQLGRIRRQSAWFLVSTVIVSLVALLILASGYPPTEYKGDPWSNQIPWLVVTIVAAIITILGSFFLYQQIQEDLKVLLAVIRAGDPSVTVSTSIDSM